MTTELSHEEMLRYNRQIVLRGFDFEGQEKLKQARILIVGLGGLGCAVAQYLASAGVGQLILLDFDIVSLSNLQRQILHRDTHIGMAKVDSAKLTLTQINPHCDIISLNNATNQIDLNELISQTNLVVDCTDNIITRHELNNICYVHRIPLVSGAALRMEGQIMIFTYQKDEPCYHCYSQLFGTNNLTCSESGVMAPLVGIIGNIQAMEVIKLLTHFGSVLSGRLLFVDAMTMQFREMRLKKDPCCPVCSN